jgi:Spy/CpxP family protein refolding chaperone
MKLLAGILCISAGLLCAQGPRPDFARSGGGKGGPIAQLNLSTTQQNAIYTVRADMKVQTQGMREQLRTLDDQLTAAIKAGDEGTIDGVTANIARIQGQMDSIQAKGMSKIYQSLTADQKALVDKLPGGARNLLRGGPGGRGRGPGGPPPPAQQ